MEHREYCQGNLTEFTIAEAHVPCPFLAYSLPGLWPLPQSSVIVDRTNLFVHLYKTQLDATGRIKFAV
jgi:hypothetical protein